MANIKIQQLATKTTPDDTDVMIIEDTISTKKILVSDLVGDPVVDSGAGYIRYKSGLQICWGKILVTNGTTQAIGPLYRSPAVTRGYFVQKFTVAPTINVSSSHYEAFFAYVSDVSDVSVGVRLVHVFNQTVAANVDYMAFGFWK